MIFLIILVCLSLSVGIYLILAQAFHLPTFKSTRIIRSLRKTEKKRNIINDIANTTAPKLMKFMPLNAIKEIRYKRALTSAGLEIAPKEYLARAFMQALIIAGIPFLLFLIFNRVAALLMVGIGIYIFLSEKQKIFKLGNKRRDEIDAELPRFAKYVMNSFQTVADLKDIIRHYIKNNDASPLIEELTITLADMEVSSIEKGLKKLDQRIDSAFISDLVRGLISKVNGENVSVFMETLIVKMQDVWKQNLEMKALKTEPKLSMLTMIIFGVVIITLVVVLGSVLASTGGGMLLL